MDAIDMGVFIIAMIIIIKHRECLVRASQRLTKSIPREVLLLEWIVFTLTSPGRKSKLVCCESR